MDNWIFPQVTRYYKMFAGADAFNQDISTWSMKFAYSIEYMFDGAMSFSQDLSAWNLGKHTKTKHAFKNAHSMKQGFLPKKCYL